MDGGNPAGAEVWVQTVSVGRQLAEAEEQSQKRSIQAEMSRGLGRGKRQVECHSGQSGVGIMAPGGRKSKG